MSTAVAVTDQSFEAEIEKRMLAHGFPSPSLECREISGSPSPRTGAGRIGAPADSAAPQMGEVTAAPILLFQQREADLGVTRERDRIGGTGALVSTPGPRQGAPGVSSPVVGDAARGKAIYQERGCAACHVLGGAGRAFGPDLSEIGAQRGAAYIKQAILEPSARVPDGHVVVTAKPKDARSVRGVRVSEDVFWVYVRDPGGKIYRYWKPDLEALEREAGASLMPAYGAERRPTEIDDLVTYLASLRGPQ